MTSLVDPSLRAAVMQCFLQRTCGRTSRPSARNSLSLSDVCWVFRVHRCFETQTRGEHSVKLQSGDSSGGLGSVKFVKKKTGPNIVPMLRDFKIIEHKVLVFNSRITKVKRLKLTQFDTFLSTLRCLLNMQQHRPHRPP